MELFNEYYNSDIQFLLGVYSLNRVFSEEEAVELAKAAHAYAPYGGHMYALQKWVKLGLIEKIGYQDYQICQEPRLYSFPAPPNRLEMEYLSSICGTDEAKWFLPESLIRDLAGSGPSMLDWIKRQNTCGKQNEIKRVDPNVFRNLLKAIYEGRSIEHDFRTNNDPSVRCATVIPYRLEHSVFDGRWWLISYDETEKRPIKSKLDHIKAVRILGKHYIKEDTIREAIMQNMVSTPVVLRINNNRNALERCFLTFENMLDMAAFKINDNEYELRFKYFKWDRNIIIRKLLYLGENVVVKSPDTLIQDMVSELKKAVAAACEQLTHQEDKEIKETQC